MSKQGRMVLAVALVLGLAALGLVGVRRFRTKEPGRHGGAGFVKLEVPAAGYSLFDLGVVDANGDGNLDLFTTNHNARQTLAFGDGLGGFADGLVSSGLSQDPRFPAAEDADAEPALSSPGLYIYWYRRKLHVRGHGLESVESVRGRLEVTSSVVVRSQEGFRLDTTAKEVAPGLTRTRLRFEAQTGAGDRLLALRPRFIGVAVSFELDKRLPLASIYVGAGRVSPPAHRFTLFLKDRHGVAWADSDGDGRMDLFIARGGLKGEMKNFPETYSDELFRHTDGSFEDVTKTSGLAKQSCRARQVAWVDFDRDGRLDLYISCRNGAPQLHRQIARGPFAEVAAAAGLDTAADGSFLWLDADSDGDQDLFVAGAPAFRLYRNEGGRFQAEPIESGAAAAGPDSRRARPLGRPTVADYDTDGDLDIFVASPRGTALLLNEQGRYRLIEPPSLGLPAKARTANWVDFDNDGLMDLHLIPGGLYRQRPEGRFEATGWLDPQREAGSPIVDARCTWADFDNDGFRDLLMAVLEEKNRSGKRWTTSLYRNPGSKHHWLEIRLIGLPGNREALGARVTLRTVTGKQTGQPVGAAEGSLYSQGHYRLYFGLGDEQGVESVRVTWPDGKVQEVRRPRLDRLLEIPYQPAN